MTGDTLATFTATDNHPPVASYATPDVRGDNPVLDYDAAANEYAIFSGIWPRHYAGGGIAVTVHWAASSALSGACVWRCNFKQLPAGVANADLDLGTFDVGGFDGTAKNGTGSPSATSGQLTATTITFTPTEAATPVAGVPFRMFVGRLAGDAGDTMAGDAELLAVELREA